MVASHVENLGENTNKGISVILDKMSSFERWHFIFILNFTSAHHWLVFNYLRKSEGLFFENIGQNHIDPPNIRPQ